MPSEVKLHYKVRAAIYIATAIGTPLVAYLFSKGIIGEIEVSLWAAEVTVASTIATFNVHKK